MKSLLILLILIPLSFLKSPAQALNDDVVPTERELKEWCLALHGQNIKLWQSNLRKDTIINDQNTIIGSQRKRIASYERDSLTTREINRAYEERLTAHQTIHTQDRKIIRKLKGEKTIGATIAIIVITLLSVKAL